MEILKQLNRKIRSLRPQLPVNEVCQVFEDGGLLEIGFLSRRCKNDFNGSCLMCDYGCAAGMQSQETYIQEMTSILDNVTHPVECLLLCTNGSFFDESQIPLSLFRAILILTSQYDIPTVEFETHYLDVSREKLDMIRKILPGKQILIEMGLESIDQAYQENVIMKNIDLSAYEKTIQTIQEYGFEVETNIMVGLPFLDVQEQLKSAFHTTMWSLAHQCRVVLFPVNIKPFTVLMQMYQQGLYSPVSHWLLILLLDALPVEELGKVTVAWYGNREETYDGSSLTAIFPSACSHCREKIMQFYPHFLRTADCWNRKYRIAQLMASCECTCLTDQLRLFDRLDAETFEERYSKYCDILKSEYIDKENWHV